jgi:hypothetical protein
MTGAIGTHGRGCGCGADLDSPRRACRRGYHGDWSVANPAPARATRSATPPVIPRCSCHEMAVLRGRARSVTTTLVERNQSRIRSPSP